MVKFTGSLEILDHFCGHKYKIMVNGKIKKLRDLVALLQSHVENDLVRLDLPFGIGVDQSISSLQQQLEVSTTHLTLFWWPDIHVTFCIFCLPKSRFKVSLLSLPFS